jgi:hypothetical protein
MFEQKVFGERSHTLHVSFLVTFTLYKLEKKTKHIAAYSFYNKMCVCALGIGMVGRVVVKSPPCCCLISLVRLVLVRHLVLGEFTGQLAEPLAHSVDLLGGLHFALGDVSLRPFGESSGDLLDATDGVVGVVSSLRSGNVAGIVLSFASLSWSAVLARLVIESAQFESSLESRRVSVKFGTPVCRLLAGQVVVGPLVGKLVELVEPLERVSWRHFLLGGGERNKCNKNLHFISRLIVT